MYRLHVCNNAMSCVTCDQSFGERKPEILSKMDHPPIRNTLHGTNLVLKQDVWYQTASENMQAIWLGHVTDPGKMIFSGTLVKIEFYESDGARIKM